MKKEQIVEIGINKADQLYVKPMNEQFTMIWRSATEVHWNIEGKFLYSPKLREWSYLDWYKHIVSVIADEYKCKLQLNNSTTWLNIADTLKDGILKFDSEFK